MKSMSWLALPSLSSQHLYFCPLVASVQTSSPGSGRLLDTGALLHSGVVSRCQMRCNVGRDVKSWSIICPLLANRASKSDLNWIKSWFSSLLLSFFLFLLSAFLSVCLHFFLSVCLSLSLSFSLLLFFSPFLLCPLPISRPVHHQSYRNKALLHAELHWICTHRHAPTHVHTHTHAHKHRRVKIEPFCSPEDLLNLCCHWRMW